MNPTCHSDPRYMMVPIIWKVDATRAQKWRYHFPCTIALYLHAVHSTIKCMFIALVIAYNFLWSLLILIRYMQKQINGGTLGAVCD